MSAVCLNVASYCVLVAVTRRMSSAAQEYTMKVIIYSFINLCLQCTQPFCPKQFAINLAVPVQSLSVMHYSTFKLIKS